MLRTVLVKAAIDEGAYLIAELGKARLKVRKAIWYLNENGVWELALGIPDVGTRGPLFVYGKVRKVLDRLQLKYVAFNHVRALRPDSGEFENVENTARMGGNWGLGYTTGPAQDIGESDAYFYRLRAS